MAEQVKTGAPIELDLTLESQAPAAPARFVRVILKDKDGGALPASPVALTDQGDDRFFDDSVAKPPGSVTAFFEVFKDAGFAVRDINFKDVTERYIDPPFTTVFAESFTMDIGEQEPLDLEIGDASPLELEIGDNAPLELDIGQDEPFELEIGDPNGLELEIGDC